MKENFKYQDAEKFDWHDLRAANSEPSVMPFSVYMPLNMPYSEKFIQCAPTFCAYVLSVPPDLCAHSPFARPLRNSLKTLLLDFAFGNPPSVPDFRKTKMERIGGKYPQVKMSYYHFGLLYEFEYCAAADNTLWIKASVTNRKEITLQAHLRARAGNYRELDIFNYFYYPFYWDSTKYKEDCSIHFAEDCMVGPDGIFCRVHPGGFEFSREESFEFKDDDYNHCDNFENPGWIPPFLRLKSGGRNIHFSAELSPGEKKSFSLAVRKRPT